MWQVGHYRYQNIKSISQMVRIVENRFDKHRNLLGHNHQDFEQHTLVFNSFERIDLDQLFALDVIEFQALPMSIPLRTVVESISRQIDILLLF